MDGNQSIGYLDLEIYEKLFGVLEGNFPQADAQQIISELRDELPVVNSPSLKVIHQTTLNCSKCPNLNANAALPKWNVSDPDLMVVLPNPSISTQASEILIEALKNSGFSASRATLTYATRCTAPKGVSISKSDCENCSNYLMGEISHLKPKLIMLLGKVSADTFNPIFDGETLKDTVGHINWLGPWAYMVVESPEYIAHRGSTDTYKAYFKNAYSFCYSASV